MTRRIFFMWKKGLLASGGRSRRWGGRRHRRSERHGFDFAFHFVEQVLIGHATDVAERMGVFHHRIAGIADHVGLALKAESVAAEVHDFGDNADHRLFAVIGTDEPVLADIVGARAFPLENHLAVRAEKGGITVGAKDLAGGFLNLRGSVVLDVDGGEARGAGFAEAAAGGYERKTKQSEDSGEKSASATRAGSGGAHHDGTTRVKQSFAWAHDNIRNPHNESGYWLTICAMSGNPGKQETFPRKNRWFSQENGEIYSMKGYIAEEVTSRGLMDPRGNDLHSRSEMVRKQRCFHTNCWRYWQR